MTGPATAVGRAAVGTVFGSLARVLGTRPLHPSGVAFEAELVVDEPRLRGARLFARRGRRPAYVRFSRGFGLPEPIPELMSMAVKIPNAYGPGREHDLLMAASGDRPLLRHVFAWGGTHLDRAYSTVLPFRVGDRTMLLGAVPRGVGVDGVGRRPGDLPELEAAAAAGELAFDLRVATPLGPWRTVARLEVGRQLSDEEGDALAFNSAHTGGGIEPVGYVNRVRAAAYDAAAAGRDA